MIEKKNPKKDLENKRLTFVLIGLVIALLVSYSAINYKVYEKSESAGLGELVVEQIDDEEVTVTQEQKTPPPPPPPPPPPVVVVVDDKVEIKEEAIFQDAETDEEEEIEIVEEEEEVETDEVFNFAVVEDKPVFPGCEKEKTKAEKSKCFNMSVMKHVRKVFKYPKLAKQMGTQEKVYVEFVIGKSGKIESTRILRGKDKHLKAEAIRIVKSLPKMKPAKQRGKAVKMKYTLPINFKLK
ncbi:MAG: TonB family protein [Flavobacteriales bacterium]|jgi:protein TonB|nr:TonB family protein [Flavobacteriales bacterium]